MTTILTPTGEITAGFPTTTSTTGRTADRSRWNSITHVVRMKTIIDDAWCPNSRRTLPSRGKDIHEAAASTSTRQQCTDRTTASSAGRRTAHSTRLDPLTALQSRLVWSSSLPWSASKVVRCRHPLQPPAQASGHIAQYLLSEAMQPRSSTGHRHSIANGSLQARLATYSRTSGPSMEAL